MSELFSNLGIDVKLLLAQAVNFLLVLWLLNRFVFRKILRFLDERSRGIEKGVELTAQAKREMERIGEARHRALQQAKGEAEGILKEAKAKGAGVEKELTAEAREEAELILQKAKEEGERNKQDALKKAEQELQEQAFLLAEKVLSRSFSKEDEERMGEDLLKELKNHG